MANLADDLPDPSPDGRTYVFRLRRSTRFSNGAPVRPEDVRASIERLLVLPDPDFKPDVPPIRGAAHCERKSCDLSQGIETDRATRTVTIHLSRPDPEFLAKLAYVYIVPAGSPARAVTTRPLPGTRPYMIERWDPRRGGLLVRNPHFDVWSPDRPDGFPDQLVMRLEPPRAQLAAVDRGAADIALLPREIHGVARLRTPAGTGIGPDLARARRLVAASGTRGMKVEFWGTQPWPRIGRYFRSLLAELGYRGELRTFDDLHLIIENAAGEPRPRPQLGLWGWGASSPFNFFHYLASCSSPYNLSRFCDPELDAEMKRAVGARGEEANELWRGVETSLADQAPIVPLVTSNNISLTAERVGNYQYHPVWGPLIEQLWVR